MGEPGWKVPKAPKEDCWAIVCPVEYCSANADNPCMNPKGRFTKGAHNARRRKFAREAEAGSPEGVFGPGNWSRRPNKDHISFEDGDSRHLGSHGMGWTGTFDDKGKDR